MAKNCTRREWVMEEKPTWESEKEQTKKGTHKTMSRYYGEAPKETVLRKKRLLEKY